MVLNSGGTFYISKYINSVKTLAHKLLAQAIKPTGQYGI